MSDPMISTVEAARLAGVTVKQLRTWTERGYVQPRTENGNLAWPIGEIDRAEMMGVLGRCLGKDDLYLSLAEAVESGTYLVLPDRDYEVVISWRPRQ